MSVFLGGGFVLFSIFPPIFPPIFWGKFNVKIIVVLEGMTVDSFEVFRLLLIPMSP